MLRPGIYVAENDDSIYDQYKITMEVKETEKSYIFRLSSSRAATAAHISKSFSKTQNGWLSERTREATQ